MFLHIYQPMWHGGLTIAHGEIFGNAQRARYSGAEGGSSGPPLDVNLGGEAAFL
jgi:hypothetical protein